MQISSIDPPVIAHRGASSYAPENTFAAFLKAKELGIRWVEFDVMLTSLNEVVVIHDETLQRTTHTMGNVSDYSYDYLKTLDAGSWFHPSFASERIPLLKELIPFLNEQGLSANIEIKAHAGNEELTAKTVMDIIQSGWKKNIMPPLISSFSLPILEWVRAYSKEAVLGLLMNQWNADWKKIADALQCKTVDVNHTILNREKTKEIKSTDRLVLAYTVNEKKRAQELFSWGVDAVFSDCPEKIIQ